MSISPVSALEERIETTPLQRWAASLQEVPQPPSLPQLSLQPASQAAGGNLLSQIGSLLEAMLPLLGQLGFSLPQQHEPLLNSLAGSPSAAGPSSLGAPQPTMAAPAAPQQPSPSTSESPVLPAPAVHSVREAASRTQPRFMPVLRGDEQQKDSQIRTQADFGRAADQVARDYGLDPNLFRAQLQSESSAFTQDFRKSMRHEGDLDRAGENNTSIGLGQISRKFLDGREWSDDGPGNPRVGSQVVTTAQYMDSPTVQLRMAASNLAQRVADHGSLEQGLAYYVSGDPDPGNAHASKYLTNIDRAMNEPAVVDVGR